MKKWYVGMFLSVLAITAFVVMSGTSPVAAGKPAPTTTATQTGQAIMVNLKCNGTYTFTATDTYKFNKTIAATYFTNAWDNMPPVVSISNSSGGGKCTPAAPATPSAPLPDPTKLINDPFNPGKDDVVGKNMCKFLDGTTLVGDSYPQSTTATASCTDDKGKTATVTYTYTFNYKIEPLVTATAPFTAWDKVGYSGSTVADVALSAEIAGESWMTSKQHPLPGKYSFSLFDSSMDNRVQNLAVKITDAFGTMVFDSATEVDASGVLLYPSGIPSGLVYPVDFAYKTNAGSNGVTTYLKDGDARTILNTDVFAGNDNGGADGSALAEAIMNTVVVPLGVGNYTVTLTGVVKGNSANATTDQAFTVKGLVDIVTPGCGSN
jgi:hypothetical protein